MKGFAIAEFGGAVLVLLAVIVAIFVAVIAMVMLQLPFGEDVIASRSVEFVASGSEAFSIASALSHYLAGDRQFMERAAQLVETASLKNNEDLASYLYDFAAPYDEMIFVTVKKNEKVLFSFNKIPGRCGPELEGFCVPHAVDLSRVGSVPVPGLDCGKGRKKIDGCGIGYDCCTEDYARKELRVYKDPDVIMCGVPDHNGIRPGVCDFVTARSCAAGRIMIEEENDECSNPFSTSPASMGCCAPITSLPSLRGLASKAEFPVMYKDSVGRVEVTVR
ncbi:MAG: hypothetical protein HY518_04160 [Candidatus Aenigmarchaeota archaeon]|nr:hypothetical protein [Candidatus Aenigmarchaeota archaeon]